jgi:hypothetical protein
MLTVYERVRGCELHAKEFLFMLNKTQIMKSQTQSSDTGLYPANIILNHDWKIDENISN